MFYIIYFSSARKLFTDADLSDILTKSRVNNTSKDITGLLLYHDGSILQILEGDKDVVMDLYYTIEMDNRHNNVIEMVSGMTDVRNFPDWSMGFKTVTGSEWEKLSGYLKLNNANLLSHLKNSNREVNSVVNSYMKVSLR